VSMRLYVPRPLRAAIALVVLLALAGATYQGVTTSLERRRYPHPGRREDVGGHQLQIYCTGTGTPTVVLEAPAAGLSASWTRVQAALTSLSRVCSYDRAGLGWSERGDGGFHPALVPGELRALLASTREPAPYVVAGHGLGAAFAAAFATLYPDITAAVVLLDAPKPNHPSADRAILGPMPEAMPWLARVGVTRLMKGPWGRDGDPAARAFMHRPDHLTRAAQELAAWDEAVRLASALGGTGSAPASTPVTALDLPAPLTTEQGAEAAVTAIRQAVTRVRRVR